MESVKLKEVKKPEDYLSEDELSDTRDNIALIAKEIIAENIGILCGAGMSMGRSGGISGSELSFQLIKEVFFPTEKEIKEDTDLYKEISAVVSKYPLEAIAEACTVKLPTRFDGVKKILKDKVLPAGSLPHDGHTALAAIAQACKIQKIFTTNYDDLIEKPFNKGAEPIFDLMDLRNLQRILSENKVAIIHLHGAFDKDPIFTEFDLMASQLNKPIFQFFLSELLNKIFIFIGYSLNDSNIRTIYFKAKETINARKETDKNNYVVYPVYDKTERKIAIHIWKNRGAELIPLDAEIFLVMLHKRVAEDALDDWKKDIGLRLGLSVETLDSKVEMILGMFPDFGDTAQVLRYLDAISRKPKK